MEVTEPETARRLSVSKVREALIESNNGGRGFARNVMEHLKRIGAKKCNMQKLQADNVASAKEATLAYNETKEH